MTDEALVTEAEASQRLGVSAVYLRGLLDSGRLASQERAGERRIAPAVLKAFTDAEREDAHAALDALTARARELGLG